MAEEKMDSRETTWQQLFPWTELFKAFQVALDLNKLLLAAAGILVMWVGWWLLAIIFAAGDRGPAIAWQHEDGGGTPLEWKEFREKRRHWNLMHKAAGLTDQPVRYEVVDVADTLPEYNLFKGVQNSKDPRQAFLDRVAELEKAWAAKQEGGLSPTEARRYRAKASQYALVGRVKPSGLLSVGPWFENRGPNPYLLTTGQAGIPWEPGYFWEWFTRDQAPVMIEPLIKMLRPIFYFLSPENGGGWPGILSKAYFLTVSLFTLLTWSIFGGAITRIAVVQLARGEKIGVFEALRFTFKRLLSYVVAPLFPLVFVAVLAVIQVLFWMVGTIPVVGDFFGGLLWPIPLVFGIIQAVALVGLVGWPLMAATISAEGTDSWEAVSRSYSYVFQRPWHYAWLTVVSIAYGGVCVFFVGFMASFAVYLAKWGTSQVPYAAYAQRDSHALFIYAPTSFGWRELLLEGAQVYESNKRKEFADQIGADVVQPRSEHEQSNTGDRWNRLNQTAYNAYLAESLAWWNKVGAFLVSVWLGVFFILVLGFGYSFFWTASTIIYLLLRRSVDAAEMDEVYLEEDDYEPYQMPAPAPAPAPAPQPATPGHSLPMIEAPKPAPPPAAIVPPPTAPAPAAPPMATPAAPAPAPAPTPTPKPEPPPPSPPAAVPEGKPSDIPPEGASTTTPGPIKPGEDEEKPLV